MVFLCESRSTSQLLMAKKVLMLSISRKVRDYVILAKFFSKKCANNYFLRSDKILKIKLLYKVDYQKY